MIKKILTHPLFWFILFLIILFREALFQNQVLVPADTLVGSYYPWLDSKWDYPTGVPVKNPPISDVFSQFFIWKHQTIDLWRQGIVPLWNKLSFSGTPLLPSIHWGVFFPGNLFLLLPKFTGWNLYLIASTVSAFLFMYLFLGRLLKSSFAKFTGSLIFAFAGPMTTWFEFGTGVWAASLIPLCLYLIDRFLTEKKFYLLALLSLSFTSLIFAGHAQLLTYAGVILPLFALSRQQFNLTKQTLLVAFSLLLGLGLSAIQLLPTFEFYQVSIRELEKYASDFNYGLSPVIELIRLWAPDFFGSPSTYNHWSSVSYHEYSSFLGTISLPLITSLFFTHSRKKYHFFFVLFFVSLFLAVNSPVSRFIFSLPLPLLTYSSASRLFFLTGLSAAVLVAGSLEELRNKKLNIKASTISSLLLIVITLLAIKFTPLQFQTTSLRNSAIPVALLATFLISLNLFHRRPFILLFIIPLLFMGDFGRYFRKYNPSVPARIVFPTTPVIDFLKSQNGVFRIARTKDNLLPPNTWSYYGLEAVEGYDPLRLLNYNRLFNVINQTSFLNKPSRYSELENFDPRYLDALNVKYFVTLKEGLSGRADMDLPILEKHRYQEVFRDGSVVVYQSPTYKDRAYFASNYQIANSNEDLDKKLRSLDLDPRTTAILSEELTFPISPCKDCRVEVLSHVPNKVKLQVSTDANALLVLADTYVTDWQAYIDDQETKIYQANGALRSIIVPPGEHNVVFHYSPLSFRRGLLISSISLVVTSIFSFYLGIKKRL